MSVYCPDCEINPNLGEPSHARWLAPDESGTGYCSMHFIHRFGHGEKLIPVEDYVPPITRKAPAPRQPKPTTVRKGEVSA